MDNQTTSDTKTEKLALAGLRLFVSAVCGVVGGVLVGVFVDWKYAPLAVWDISALIFIIWIWAALSGRNAEETSRLATREDPSHLVTDVVLLLASVASLAAVGVMLFNANTVRGEDKIVQVFLGIASVIISWAVVHTVYTLRYARVYYKNQNRGIDFNTQDSPSYSDFAYLAFTIGMTFQVADTNLRTSELRKIVLRHAMLSYLFATVIVASAISLIVGLGGK